MIRARGGGSYEYSNKVIRQLFQGSQEEFVSFFFFLISIFIFGWHTEIKLYINKYLYKGNIYSYIQHRVRGVLFPPPTVFLGFCTYASTQPVRRICPHNHPFRHKPAVNSNYSLHWDSGVFRGQMRAAQRKKEKREQNNKKECSH